jgi:hypothetical protein
MSGKRGRPRNSSNVNKQFSMLSPAVAEDTMGAPVLKKQKTEKTFF